MSTLKPTETEVHLKKSVPLIATLCLIISTSLAQSATQLGQSGGISRLTLNGKDSAWSEYDVTTGQWYLVSKQGDQPTQRITAIQPQPDSKTPLKSDPFQPSLGTDSTGKSVLIFRSCLTGKCQLSQYNFSDGTTAVLPNTSNAEFPAINKGVVAFAKSGKVYLQKSKSYFELPSGNKQDCFRYSRSEPVKCEKTESVTITGLSTDGKQVLLRADTTPRAMPTTARDRF